jgi:DNA topoisomerase-1
MLALPRQLGNHTETGKPVEVNIGRFGPYIKHDSMFKSIPKAESVHDITLTRAIELLAEKKAGGGGGRSLGTHPSDNRTVAVHSGRYGPYVKYGKINATIPASIDPEKITLDEALALLSTKSPKGAKTAKPRKSGKTAKTAKTGKAPKAEKPGKSAATAAPAAAAIAKKVPKKKPKSAAKKKTATKTTKRKAA